MASINRARGTDAAPHSLAAWSEGTTKHACPIAETVTEWLDRQRLLGHITPEGAAAVERLIEDLR